MKGKSSLNEKSEVGINSSHCSQRNLSLLPYWGLVFLRFLLTVFPQTGYIHPDEFFQSVEVVAGDVLGVDVVRSWEFNSTRPIRSIAFPYLVSWLPFSLEKYIFYKEEDRFIPPTYLVIGPRLIVCCLSFITDYCLYCTCYIYGQNYRARLLAFASSYAAIVYGTRTLSNTIEMTLTSVVLCCVAEAMCHTDQVLYQDNYLQEKLKEAGHIAERVKISRLRSKLPSHTLRHCVILGAAIALGVFVRPTILIFTAPAVFFWLRRGPRHSPKSENTPSSIMDLPPFAHFHVRAAALAACATLLSIPFLVLDTFYYDKRLFKNTKRLLPVIATPFNFILYNSNPDNLQHHGLHPHWLHLMVNLPLLFGPLGISALLGLGRLALLSFSRRWARLPRSESSTALMSASLIVPLAILSAIPHQEPRFLLPLAFPIVFLYAQDIRGPNSDDSSISGVWTRFHKMMPYVWCIFNILLGFFFGFVHQGGIWPVSAELANRLSDPHAIPWGVSEVHIFASHTYMIPRHPLQISSERTRRLIKFHEMGSANMTEVVSGILALNKTKVSRFHRSKMVYLVLPGSLEEDFRVEAAKNFLEVELEWSHSPHVSTEALPSFLWENKEPLCVDAFSTKEGIYQERNGSGYCLPLKIYSSAVERFFRKFSLLLLKVSPTCAKSVKESWLTRFSM